MWENEIAVTFEMKSEFKDLIFSISYFIACLLILTLMFYPALYSYQIIPVPLFIMISILTSITGVMLAITTRWYLIIISLGAAYYVTLQMSPQFKQMNNLRILLTDTKQLPDYGEIIKWGEFNWFPSQDYFYLTREKKENMKSDTPNVRLQTKCNVKVTQLIDDYYLINVNCLKGELFF